MGRPPPEFPFAAGGNAVLDSGGGDLRGVGSWNLEPQSSQIIQHGQPTTFFCPRWSAAAIA